MKKDEKFIVGDVSTLCSPEELLSIVYEMVHFR